MSRASVTGRTAARESASIEQWKSVPGFDGYYEVSDFGRVRSVDRVLRSGRRLKGVVLRASAVGVYGHLKVTVSRDGKASERLIHRLVLEAFIGPCPDGMECCHNDGDPTNNALENLRWGTHAENMQDRIRHGNNPAASKTHCPSGHPYDGENTYHTPSGSRSCRPCNRAAVSRYKLRKNDAAVAA